MKKKIFGVFLSLILILGIFSQTAFAEEMTSETPFSASSAAENLKTDSSVEEPYSRTIMMYDCGSNLETYGGMATYNLHQILNANFSAGDKVKFIIMTGGSEKWQLESEYLYDPETGSSPGTIDPDYNQIWEVKGADAAENASKMVLLEKEGLNGTRTNDPEDEFFDGELMTDPEILKGFIDYCAANYPAEKYDLILWDHGGGPFGGFGGDEHDGFGGQGSMSFAELMDAFSDNAVTENGGKFDFINFDACLMGSVEMTMAFADYMDYFIVSPETVPGYGQDYSGWLNELGASPDMDAFEIGKKIVDDFIAFYDKPEGDGSSQEGTLAVIDVKKLMESGFVETLYNLAGVLIRQANEPDPETGDYLFYDEFDSAKNSIQYGKANYYDLGTLVSMLSYDFKELTPGDIIDGEVIDTNMFTETLSALIWILNNQEIIYARGTKGIHSEPLRYKDIYGKDNYGEAGTCGLYLYFPSGGNTTDVMTYTDILKSAAEKLPESSQSDKRQAFFIQFIKALTDYALIDSVGKGVSDLLDEGKARSEINFDTLKSYMSDGQERPTVPMDDPDYNWDYFVSRWSVRIEPLLMQKAGGRRFGYSYDEITDAENQAKDWLDAVIRQQAKENISRDDTVISAVKGEGGTAYRIQMNHTQKRVVEDVRYNLMVRLPAVEQYILENFDEEEMLFIGGIKSHSVTSIGTVSGELLYETEEGEPIAADSKAEYVEWYLTPGGIWKLAPLEESWYVVRDADGYQHVAEIKTDASSGELYFYGTYLTENGIETMCALGFDSEGDLAEILLGTEDGSSFRTLTPDNFVGEVSVMPIKKSSTFFSELKLPMSKAPIILNEDTIHSVKLTRENLDSIEDLRFDDPEEETSGIVRTIVIRDIYGHETEYLPDDIEDDPAVEDISYRAVSDTDAVWTKGSKTPLSVIFERNTDDETTFNHFTGIELDGTAVSDSDYTAEAGSVVITLKTAFPETLPEGSHVLKAVFDDGSAEKEIVIKAAAPAAEDPDSGTGTKPEKEKKSSPKTSDTQQPVMWVLLLTIASILLAASIIIYRRRSQKQKR